VPHHPDRDAVASLAVTVQPLRRYCRFPEPSFVAFVEARVPRAARARVPGRVRKNPRRHHYARRRLARLLLVSASAVARPEKQLGCADRIRNRGSRRPVRWTNRGVRETSPKVSHGARTRSTFVECLGIGARTTRSIHAYAIAEASGRRSVRWTVTLDPLDFHAQSLDLGHSPLVVISPVRGFLAGLVQLFAALDKRKPLINGPVARPPFSVHEFQILDGYHSTMRPHTQAERRPASQHGQPADPHVACRLRRRPSLAVFTVTVTATVTATAANYRERWRTLADDKR
jgi:hypothetical protein